MSDLRLTIDLLPKGAWGNNLRERLSGENWDTLRNICYQKAGYRCSVCGKQDEQLNAHEVWEFDMEKKTQTLKDIAALCRACHGVKHIRNSERMGYGQQAKAHFMKVNQCTSLVFAKHYTDAMLVFNERNQILRWKLIADLQKFGGKDMEMRTRCIPLIVSPYEKVDFETVKHTRIADNGNSPETDQLISETIVLQSAISDTIPPAKPETPTYYTVHKPDRLPPKIRSIAIDNYSGVITVESDRVNKIVWLDGDKAVKTEYNFSGKFIASFSVENVKAARIGFALINLDGKTFSQDFELIGDIL